MTALGNLDDARRPQAPRRVVSLVPSLTETLFDLGCGDRLAAVTDYCVHPADRLAGLPRIGGPKNPNRAAIMAARPDLVLANQEENRPEDVAALQAAGLNVWVTFPRSVADVIAMLWAMLQVFEVTHLTPVVDALERAYEWASLAAENRPPVRAFCPIWREPAAPEPPRWWMTINGQTYVHDVLRVCGVANVFAARARRYPLAADLGQGPADAPDPARDIRYPRVTPAEVAEQAPELVIFPSEPYAFTAEDGAALDAFPDLPAVRDRRLVWVDGSLLTWPGTRLGRALSELPALFQDLNQG